MFNIFRRNDAASYTLVEESSDDGGEQQYAAPKQSWRNRHGLVAHFILIASILLLFLSLSRYAYLRTNYLTDEICLRRTSAPSQPHALKPLSTQPSPYADDVSDTRPGTGGCELPMDAIPRRVRTGRIQRVPLRSFGASLGRVVGL